MKGSAAGFPKPLVKICGIRTPAEVAMLNGLRPDFAGFILAPSRRRVEPKTLAALVAQLAPSVRPVGVFVDEAPDRVARIARACGLFAVQLHGAEDRGYVGDLRARLPAGVEIWKAVRMGAPDARPDAAGADRLLLDGAVPGSGRTFDWAVAEAVETPCILAGGLTPENLQEALDRLHPFAVDASSGVEDETGCKNAARIAAFLTIARGKRP